MKVKDVSLLFAFDDVRLTTRCETTIFAVRSGQGNYSGPIEVVGPPDLKFTRDYHLHIRTIQQVVGWSNVPLQPPKHCSTLNEKRRRGWNGYYFKTLASMSSFWAYRYRRMIFIDCGMQVHKPLEPLLQFDPGPLIAAHSACYPEYQWGMSHVIHSSCDIATANSLFLAYPGAAQSDYFQSTLMVYPTKLLGRSYQTLREIVDVYHRFGAVVEGDQELLSLYWIHNRSAARTLPLVGPHCLYDYLPRKPHPQLCETFVMTKLSYIEAIMMLGNSWKRGHTVRGLLHHGKLITEAEAKAKAEARHRDPRRVGAHPRSRRPSARVSFNSSSRGRQSARRHGTAPTASYSWTPPSQHARRHPVPTLTKSKSKAKLKAEQTEMLQGS